MHDSLVIDFVWIVEKTHVEDRCERIFFNSLLSLCPLNNNFKDINFFKILNSYFANFNVEVR